MESMVRKLYEVPGRIRKLKKGETVFSEGDEAQYFYIVRSGQICVSKSVQSGRTLALRLAQCGSILDEQVLCHVGDTYLFNAVAKTRAEVYEIELPVLDDYLRRKPQLAYDMLTIISQHMRKQHTKFRDLILYGKKGALYSTLLRMARSYGQETPEGILITVPFTNQELANYSATTRESLNRMLSELKREGVLESRGKQLLMLDISALEAAIECEHCDAACCNVE